MTDERRGNVVRCPVCGGFVMRAAFEGSVEINCANSRCDAVLEVAIRGGKTSVTVLSTKKA